MKPRKLTLEELAAIKNSALFARKRKKAEVIFSSPAYIAHAKSRHRKRLALIKKSKAKDL